MKKSIVVYQESKRFKRKVCLDIDSADAILSFLEEGDGANKEKFDYIVDRVLEQGNRFYKDYAKIVGFENLTEFRIFPNNINARIYCQEIITEDGEIYIVAIELLPRKRDVDKVLQKRWKLISKNEYDVD